LLGDAESTIDKPEDSLDCALILPMRTAVKLSTERASGPRGFLGPLGPAIFATERADEPVSSSSAISSSMEKQLWA
jgi:hypothetical protein